MIITTNRPTRKFLLDFMNKVSVCLDQNLRFIDTILRAFSD